MKTVDVLLYEGINELDFCGPYETLAACRRLVGGRWSDKPAFHVQTVADHHSTVRCAHGLCVLPDKSLAQVFEADIVIVPGGPGARKENLPLHLIEFLESAGETAEIVASVCTGAFMVAKAGLADDRQITTHSAHLEALATQYPKAHVVRGARVVHGGERKGESKTDCGRLMSSAGMTAGLDLALAIIARYEGQETARMAAKRLEWPSLWGAAAAPAPPKTGR